MKDPASALLASAEQLLAAYQRRVRLRRVGRAAAAAGCLGAILWRAAHAGMAMPVLAGVGAFGAVALAVWQRAACRREHVKSGDAALTLDRALDLKARLVTTLEFADHPDASSLYPILARETSAAIERAGGRLPRAMDRPTMGLGALAVLLLLLGGPGSTLPRRQQLASTNVTPPIPPEPPPEPPSSDSSSQPPPQGQPGQSGASSGQQDRGDRDQQGGQGAQGSQDRHGAQQQASHASPGSPRDKGSHDSRGADGSPQAQGSQADANTESGSPQTGDSQQAQGSQQQPSASHSAQADAVQQRAKTSSSGTSGDGQSPRGSSASAKERLAQAASRGATAGGAHTLSAAEQEQMKAEIQGLLKDLSAELKEMQTELNQRSDQPHPLPGTGTDSQLYDKAAALEAGSRRSQVPIQLDADDQPTASRRKGSGTGPASPHAASAVPQQAPEDVQLAHTPSADGAAERVVIPSDYRPVFERASQAASNQGGPP